MSVKGKTVKFHKDKKGRKGKLRPDADMTPSPRITGEKRAASKHKRVVIKTKRFSNLSRVIRSSSYFP